MADSRAGPASGARPNGASPPRRPRWVTVSAAIALGLVIVVVALLVLGGGRHGPGRHLGGGSPSGGAARETPPTGVTEARPRSGGSPGHTPPARGRAHGERKR